MITNDQKKKKKKKEEIETSKQLNNSRLTWRPALAERETAFALAFPESFPALPPA